MKKYIKANQVSITKRLSSHRNSNVRYLVTIYDDGMGYNPYGDSDPYMMAFEIVCENPKTPFANYYASKESEDNSAIIYEESNDKTSRRQVEAESVSDAMSVQDAIYDVIDVMDEFTLNMDLRNNKFTSLR
jgi:hypothetical protein